MSPAYTFPLHGCSWQTLCPAQSRICSSLPTGHVTSTEVPRGMRICAFKCGAFALGTTASQQAHGVPKHRHLKATAWRCMPGQRCAIQAVSPSLHLKYRCVLSPVLSMFRDSAISCGALCATRNPGPSICASTAVIAFSGCVPVAFQRARRCSDELWRAVRMSSQEVNRFPPCPDPGV